MAASLSLVTPAPTYQWMAATASIMAKMSSFWRKRTGLRPVGPALLKVLVVLDVDLAPLCRRL